MICTQEEISQVQAEYRQAIRRLALSQIKWDLSCNISPWQKEMLEEEKGRRARERSKR